MTFLFTDVEGSTSLLKQLGEEYARLLGKQREILRRVFSQWEGTEVDTQGDAFFYSFPRASQALSAAVQAQRETASHEWPADVEVKIRMGLHTGEPIQADGGYVGMDVHRAARIAHAGHGGQILLSETTAPLIADHLPAGTRIIDLGRHRLKDMPRPERIFQVALDVLPGPYPPLKSLAALPPERGAAQRAARSPEFLDMEQHEPSAVFVGREHQLGMLWGLFDRALSGQGGISFVVGGPGRGKTALLESFCRQVTRAHPEVALTWGECSAFTGRGDPYLPFQQVLDTLTGSLRPLWSAGRISRACAIEMWKRSPAVARNVVEMGPSLIGPLLSGEELVRRVSAAVPASDPWLERLATLADRSADDRGEMDQPLLFEHVDRVLSEIAESKPLVIVLDDLQWIDSASIDLLFFLTRHLRRKPILILGAYRPEQIETDRSGEPHPLKPVLAELKRAFGEASVDLAELPEDENWSFIHSYLDSEPNVLDEGFREALYSHTEGHPLFTVELLRNMKAQNELRRDARGRWMAGPDLDWDQLPARAEGVIEERIQKLGSAAKRVLEVAAVEGEQFTPRVTSLALERSEQEVLDVLRNTLDDEHRLVRQLEPIFIDGDQSARYRFRHGLFQQYVYHEVGPSVRRLHHAQVGAALEQLYGTQVNQIAAQLARHYRLGGVQPKAVKFGLDAGDQARLAHAYRESLGHYDHALALLKGTGQTELIARTLLKIGLVHNAEGRHEQANAINQQAFELWEPLRKVWETTSGERGSASLSIAVEQPQSLDPGLASDEGSIFLINQLYEGLVQVDEESNVLPAVADRWEVLNGGHRYRFYLRPGLMWSDGSPLTAHDFAFAWRRNLRLGEKSPAAHLLHVIKNASDFAAGEVDQAQLGIHIQDDHTLEVELENPIAYLPHLLTHPVSYPLPSHLGTKPDPGWFGLPGGLTNGPYGVTKHEAPEEVVLEHDSHYRGGFPGNIGRVDVSIVHEYSLAFDRFRQGQLDIVNLILSDPATVRQASRLFGHQLRLVPQPATFYLNFRCDRPPFDDPRVRRAFVHAIDREAILKQVAYGQYEAALGGFLPPGLPGYQPAAGLAYDPELARATVARAGVSVPQELDGLEFLFTGHDRDPLIDRLCAAWKEELAVSVVPVGVPWEAFTERIRMNPPDMFVMGYMADYPDPDAMLRVLFHSAQGYNHPRWKSDEFDRLVERAGRSLDRRLRIDCYQRADWLLVAEEAAVMPLGYTLSRSLIQDGIRVPQVPAGRLRLKEVLG